MTRYDAFRAGEREPRHTDLLRDAVSRAVSAEADIAAFMEWQRSASAADPFQRARSRAFVAAAHLDLRVALATLHELSRLSRDDTERRRYLRVALATLHELSRLSRDDTPESPR